jgi:hypothetical protein
VAEEIEFGATVHLPHDPHGTDTQGSMTSVYFRNPDGNLLEVSTY